MVVGGKGEFMLKIVVFDGGWGGELVADYLAEELQTIEIERVIDWKHAPYDNKTISEMISKLSETAKLREKNQKQSFLIYHFEYR